VRIRLLVLLSVAALAGIAVFATVGSGGTGSTPVASDLTKPLGNATKQVTGREVQRSDVPQAAAAQRATSGVTLTYFVSGVKALGGGRASPIFNFSCPSGQHVITGFFTTDRFIVPDVSYQSSQSVRAWQFGFDNLVTQTGHYKFGIICAKNVAGV
jgi:hypothetical protein